MVDCKESKLRYRADQLFFAPVIVDGEKIGYVSVVEHPEQQEIAEKLTADLKRKAAKQGTLEPIVLKEYVDAAEDEYDQITSRQPASLAR